MWARAGLMLVGLLIYSQITHAITLNVNSTASIKSAAKTIAYGLMVYYHGNQTTNPTQIGILPQPYYWWEAGAMWGGLIDYWHLTNDSTYNSVTSQALLDQASPTNDFMDTAIQSSDGNDDQAFWGFAVMSAAEHSFPNPGHSTTQWLTLAVNVFNDFVRRWGLDGCNGGLKWQIFPSNAGYDYKNSAANGGFFLMAARLARFTGNSTYLDWATRSWDWMVGVGLIDLEAEGGYVVFDGTDDTKNCTTLNHAMFSYSLGMILLGSANLANLTNGSDSTLWMTRTIGLLNGTTAFFSPYPNATGIMFETSCEPFNTCDTDQQSFKAYLSRFMAGTALLVPSAYNAVMGVLISSAQAAARSCSGGTDNATCGTKWYVDGWDGTYGVGQQLAALEVVQNLLIGGAAPSVVEDTVHNLNATTSTMPSVVLPTTKPESSVGTVPATETQPPGKNVAAKATTSISLLPFILILYVAIGGF